jgi:hypothetical protein
MSSRLEALADHMRILAGPDGTEEAWREMQTYLLRGADAIDGLLAERNAAEIARLSGVVAAARELIAAENANAAAIQDLDESIDWNAAAAVDEAFSALVQSVAAVVSGSPIPHNALAGVNVIEAHRDFGVSGTPEAKT